MAASETIHLLQLSKYEDDCKKFQQSSAGMLLEKIIKKITKCFGTKSLWGSLPLVKLHAVQLKHNFSIYFFLENFKKYPEKKPKTFRKIINRTCFDGYFYKYVSKVDKTYLENFQNNLFQNALSRCILWNPLEDIFHSVHVWYDETILV